MKRNTPSIVLCTCIALLLGVRAPAQNSAFPPSGDFNGMAISYTVSGISAASVKDPDMGFVWTRTVTGALGSGQLRVSGTAKSRGIPGYPTDVAVRVWAGNESKEFTGRIAGDPSINPRPYFPLDFDVAVDIPAAATTGGFNIALTGHYNVGSRGLGVEGSFDRPGPPSAPPPARPTPPPTSPAPPPRPAPAPPARPATTPPTTVPGAVESELAEFMGQFADTCFGRVVTLGDLSKYKDAMGNHLTIHAGDAAAKAALAARPKGGSNGYHNGGILSAELVLPFDPLSTRPTWTQQQTMLHEMTHHIEWTKGIKGDTQKDANHAERNTKYVDAVVNELKAWKSVEARVIAGELSPEDARFRWNGLRQRLSRLELGYEGDPDSGYTIVAKPDDNLKALTGFNARFGDIAALYRSSACGAALQKLGLY